MDPNACLKAIRELIAEVSTGSEIDAERLAELVDALDTWISRGGFLPAAWRVPSRGANRNQRS